MAAGLFIETLSQGCLNSNGKQSQPRELALLPLPRDVQRSPLAPGFLEGPQARKPRNTLAPVLSALAAPSGCQHQRQNLHNQVQHFEPADSVPLNGFPTIASHFTMAKGKGSGGLR